MAIPMLALIQGILSVASTASNMFINLRQSHLQEEKTETNLLRQLESLRAQQDYATKEQGFKTTNANALVKGELGNMALDMQNQTSARQNFMGASGVKGGSQEMVANQERSFLAEQYIKANEQAGYALGSFARESTFFNEQMQRNIRWVQEDLAGLGGGGGSKGATETITDPGIRNEKPRPEVKTDQEIYNERMTEIATGVAGSGDDFAQEANKIIEKDAKITQEEWLKEEEQLKVEAAEEAAEVNQEQWLKEQAELEAKAAAEKAAKEKAEADAKAEQEKWLKEQAALKAEAEAKAKAEEEANKKKQEDKNKAAKGNAADAKAGKAEADKPSRERAKAEKYNMLA